MARTDVRGYEVARRPQEYQRSRRIQDAHLLTAANNLWQSIKGGITGAAVNLLIDPLTVTRIGHQAMLDFGQALVSGAPRFTFPQAKNLKNPTAKPF